MVDLVFFLKSMKLWFPSMLLTAKCSGMPDWKLGGTNTPWFSDKFLTTAFSWSFFIFITLSYEMESPRSDKYSSSFLLFLFLFFTIFLYVFQALLKTLFQPLLWNSYQKWHVLYLSIACTCFNNDLCNVFNMIIDWVGLLFLRMVLTVCCDPAINHLSNDDSETGRLNPEKLPSNFKFWYFKI